MLVATDIEDEDEDNKEEEDNDEEEETEDVEAFFFSTQFALAALSFFLCDFLACISGQARCVPLEVGLC